LRITHLSLTNFRTFTRLDVEFPRRTLLLIGDNAQGKTSLLEAIFFLATFSSFHTQTDRQLISFHENHAELVVTRIVAEIEKKGKSARIEVRLILENGATVSPRLRKEILVDGVKKKAVDALGELNAVLFLPQMLRILEGSPEDRRRYINMVLSQIIPGYGEALSLYSRALEQRNALLKLLAERGGDQGQLDYWDDLLSEHGSRIIHARINALQDLEGLAGGIHLSLTAKSEVLRFLYQPSYDPLPLPEGQLILPMKSSADRSGYALDQIKVGFMEKLTKLRADEIQRGITTIGPHRDELRFSVNGMDLGDYGSRGQARTAILSVKLAEVEWMKARSGEYPILLLDETLAELDPARRTDLLTALDQSDQAILTATDLSHFPAEFLSKSDRWTVSAGKIDANSGLEK
jgi:DNA replication and repair protein RecF